jgi:DNA-binding response OmpR family regulator
MSRILIVEDDENLRIALADNLEDEGHRVRTAGTVADADAALAAEDPDLIVLDIMLPDGDGYSLCSRYRKGGGAAMVLMLTARTLEDDLVRGFDAGADDYLAKPYRLRELLSRVGALLRRAGGRAQTRTEQGFCGIVIDEDAREVRGPAGPIPMTRTEFDLLRYFVQEQGKARSRDAILDAVWGADVIVDGRTVDNFVSSLKKKLGWHAEAGWRIRTVRGVGYRFEVDG